MCEGLKAWSVLETVHSPVAETGDRGGEGRSEELDEHQAGPAGPGP